MKKTYTAYFTPDKENEQCQVNIPELNLILCLTPEKFPEDEMIRLAKNELEFWLYLKELDGDEIPQYEGGHVQYEFSRQISVDTEEAAKRIKIEKEFDLSDIV